MNEKIENKNKKRNNIYEYTKDWTAHDFYGKYHLNHIKNKIPIPGTQIKIEQEHKEKKLNDIERYNNERKLKQIEIQKLMELKKQTSEVS